MSEEPSRFYSYTLPPEAVRYALLQRTGLQRWNPKHYRVLRQLPSIYETTLLNLEWRVRQAQITSAYWRAIAADYRQIRGYLPPSADAILDIGCGIAGIDLLLFDHYGARGDLQFYLLDRTQINRSAFRYDMGEPDRFYNSLAAAQRQLTANGLTPAQIHLIEVNGDTESRLPSGGVDLVVSLLSWGFHYPVETYLDMVLRVLRPGGVVILDVRPDGLGEAKLREVFAQVDVIYDSPEQRRLHCM